MARPTETTHARFLATAEALLTAHERILKKRGARPVTAHTYDDDATRLRHIGHLLNTCHRLADQLADNPKTTYEKIQHEANVRAGLYLKLATLLRASGKTAEARELETEATAIRDRAWLAEKEPTEI